MISVTMNQAEFRAAFGAQLEAARRPAAVLAAAGRELGNLLKRHFWEKEKRPNKLSPRREHFWLQIAQSVNAPVQTERSVSVTVSDPRIGQKVYGGPIVAKRAGALTIPVSEKAYGRTAATFEHETGLKLFRPGPAGEKKNVLMAKVGEQVEVEYVLVKSVQQSPDPTALPDMGELERKILERAKSVVDRQNREMKG